MWLVSCLMWDNSSLLRMYGLDTFPEKSSYIHTQFCIYYNIRRFFSPSSPLDSKLSIDNKLSNVDVRNIRNKSSVTYKQFFLISFMAITVLMSYIKESSLCISRDYFIIKGTVGKKTLNFSFIKTKDPIIYDLANFTIILQIKSILVEHSVPFIIIFVVYFKF
jgi:hypothetical protein